MKKNKKKPKVWILGPCALESKRRYFYIGRRLNEIMKGKRWYYKASFDKANRSSIWGKRGLGLDGAIEIFAEVKEGIPGIKLTTDIHEPSQAEKLSPYIDVIQIPAFLCRQTDLLVEAGRHFNIVNIKQGQWMNPENMVHSVGKVREKNKNAEVWLTHRGTFFGYERMVVDFGSVGLMHKHFDRVILDCTHSTQYIKDGFTLGNRWLGERYLIGAEIFGYNGVFAETHPKPEESISDGMCAVPLSRLERVLAAADSVSNVLGRHGGILK